MRTIAERGRDRLACWWSGHLPSVLVWQPKQSIPGLVTVRVGGPQCPRCHAYWDDGRPLDEQHAAPGQEGDG
jgi:hypothetical protein